MLCLLIGCTREQLEDQEFKNTELGQEWWYYLLPNQTKVNYLDCNNGELINNSELIKLTPRLLLQQLGTDCGRDMIHPDIWVNALMSGYKNKSTLINEVNYLGDSRCGICKKPTKDFFYFLCDEHIEKSKNNYPNWIITDMRFPNEMQAVKDRGGITIRVSRTGIHTPKIEDLHPSETALDNYEFDYHIDNSDTIEDLIEKVREILINEKIISF